MEGEINWGQDAHTYSFTSIESGCNIFPLQKDYKRLTRRPSGGWAILDQQL